MSDRQCDLLQEVSMSNFSRIYALRSILSAIHSHRRIVIAATLAAMAFGAILDRVPRKQYQACVRIRVTPPPFVTDPNIIPDAQAKNSFDLAQYFEAELDRLESRQFRTDFAESISGEGISKGQSTGSIVKKLDSGLRIEPDDGTNLITISFAEADPGNAKELLDAYIEFAKADNARRQQSLLNPYRQILRARLTELQDLFNAQQTQIGSYLGDSETANTDGSSSDHGSLTNPKQAYDEALKKRTEAQQKLTYFERHLLPDADLLEIADTDIAPSLQRSIVKIAESQEILGELWVEGEEKENLDRMARQMHLQQLKDQVRTELEKTVETLRSDVASLELEEKNAFNRYIRQASADQTTAARSKEISKLQEVLQNLAKSASLVSDKLKVLNAFGARTTNSALIAEPITVKSHSVPGRGFLFTSGIGFIGFLLSIGFCMARDSYNSKTKVLAKIQSSFEILNPKSFPATSRFSLRDIRKSCDSLKVLLDRNPYSCRSLMVTSSLPREGKTTVAMHLAKRLAASGASTVLLCLNQRKEGILDYSGALQKYDQALSNINGLNLRLETTDCPALHMIMPDQLQLSYLGRREITGLIRHLHSRFEWVIFDAPPVTSTKEAIKIASLVDAVLFVIKQSFVDKKIVKSSIATLNGVNATIIGTVINDFGLRTANYGAQGNFNYLLQNSHPDATFHRALNTLSLYPDSIGNVKSIPVSRKYSVG